MSALNYRWERSRFWLIEAAAWWLEPQKPDRGEWLPFYRLVALTLAVEGILALWLMGALSPHV